MTFRHNKEQSRFEYEVDGHIAEANYRKDGETIYINLVEAPLPLRGTGAAGKLMQYTMDEIRKSGFKAIPRCGYAAAWIDKHPEYKDLLA